MKIDVPLMRANRLINHGPVVLVTSRDKEQERVNIITLAWTTITSKQPPLLAISVAPGRFSHGLLETEREFVVNVPDVALLEAVQYCGTRSGRDVDKFAETGLTPFASKEISTPGISECIAHLECRVVNFIETGDHTLFIGEIVHARANKDCFDQYMKTGQNPAMTLHHLGGTHYAYPGGILQPQQ